MRKVRNLIKTEISPMEINKKKIQKITRAMIAIRMTTNLVKKMIKHRKECQEFRELMNIKNLMHIQLL